MPSPPRNTHTTHTHHHHHHHDTHTTTTTTTMTHPHTHIQTHTHTHTPHIVRMKCKIYNYICDIIPIQLYVYKYILFPTRTSTHTRPITRQSTDRRIRQNGVPSPISAPNSRSGLEGWTLHVILLSLGPLTCFAFVVRCYGQHFLDSTTQQALHAHTTHMHACTFAHMCAHTCLHRRTHAHIYTRTRTNERTHAGTHI